MSQNRNNMDTDIYSDPDEESMKLVLNELEGIGNPIDIQKLITRTFPTWLIHSTPKYSEDYPHLDKNWTFVCDKNCASKQQIVIVDCIIKDDEHLLLNIFCERMTREGYIVRRKEEFVSCGKCGAAIPCERVYKHMKDNSLPVPDEWSSTCLYCW